MLIAKPYTKFLYNESVYNGCEHVKFTVVDCRVLIGLRYQRFSYNYVKHITIDQSSLINYRDCDIYKFKKFPKLKSLSFSKINISQVFPILKKKKKKNEKGMGKDKKYTKESSLKIKKLEIGSGVYEIYQHLKYHPKACSHVEELVIRNSSYTHKVLSLFPNLKVAKLWWNILMKSEYSNMKYLKSLKKIEYLELSGKGEYILVDIMSNFVEKHKLKVIKLCGRHQQLGIGNFYEELKKFMNLEEIYIRQIDFVGRLNVFKKLKKFHFESRTKRSNDLKRIGECFVGLQSLIDLDINFRCPDIDFEFLKNLTSLKSLRIKYDHEFLSYTYSYDCDCIKQQNKIAPIHFENLKCLKSLELNKIRVNNLEKIFLSVNLKILEDLKIIKCEFNAKNLSDIFRSKGVNSITRMTINCINDYELSYLKGNSRKRTIRYPPLLKENIFSFDCDIFTFLEVLELNNFEFVKSINILSLRSLTVKRCYCITNVNCPNLIYLSCFCCYRFDKALGKKIETLILYHEDLENTYGEPYQKVKRVKKFVKDSTVIKYLYINDYPMIKDSFFRRLTQLYHLDLRYNRTLSNRIFSFTPKLRELKLDKVERINDDGINLIKKNLFHFDYAPNLKSKKKTSKQFEKMENLRITSKHFKKMVNLRSLRISITSNSLMKNLKINRKILLDNFYKKSTSIKLNEDVIKGCSMPSKFNLDECI